MFDDVLNILILVLVTLLPIILVALISYWVLDKSLPNFAKALRIPIMFVVSAVIGIVAWNLAFWWYVNTYGK